MATEVKHHSVNHPALERIITIDPFQISTVLSVSDFHIGDKSSHERFSQDEEFYRFLKYHESHPRTHLVIAGDFFDTVQVHVEGASAMDISEKIACQKMTIILTAHTQVFEGLKDFAIQNGITFLIGNHDPALAFPKVRDLIKSRIGNPRNLHFALEFHTGDLRVIHGNQWDSANRFDDDFLKLALSNRLEKMKFPWGSIFLIDFVSSIRKRIPQIEQIKPLGAYLRWSAMNRPSDFLWATYSFLKFLFKGLLSQRADLRFSPWRLYKTLKNACHSCDFISHASEALQLNSGVLIAGHTHRALRAQISDKALYLNTGCWNPILELNEGKFISRHHLSYAEIKINNSGQCSLEECLLKEWISGQGPRHFSPSFYNTHMHPPIKGLIWRSTKVALVVWPLLMLINHHQRLLGGSAWNVILSYQSLLTFCVPFTVSLVSRLGEKSN